MRPIQAIVLVLCMLINILDGFDLQAIAFTSTRIMADWGVRPAIMGLIFSAGLLGVGLGSLLLSPIADRLGRRPTILIGLTLGAFGMLTVGLAGTAAGLAALRFVTGLGIGILLPSLNSLVSEYTPVQWQSLAVSLYATGFPVGGALSGAAAPYLIEHIGWRAVYMSGGIASFLLIPVAAAMLPESLEFLLKLQPANALARAQQICARLGLPPPAALPPRQLVIARPNPLTPFKPHLAKRTILISAAFFLLWVTQFFIVNWAPTILARDGLSPAAAAAGGVMLTLGGIAGTLLIGVFAVRWALVRVCALYLLGGFGLALMFGFVGGGSLGGYVCALLGFLLFGSAAGLFAVVARIFPLEVRATGTGIALAFGRAGAVVGLSLGGFLIGLDWARPSYVGVLSLPVLVAALATYALRPFVVTTDSDVRAAGHLAGVVPAADGRP